MPVLFLLPCLVLHRVLRLVNQKCFVSGSGKCYFHDSGPEFLSYLKRASDGRWPQALADLSEWVRDTRFLDADRDGLRGA